MLIAPTLLPDSVNNDRSDTAKRDKIIVL